MILALTMMICKSPTRVFPNYFLLRATQADIRLATEFFNAVKEATASSSHCRASEQISDEKSDHRNAATSSNV